MDEVNEKVPATWAVVASLALAVVAAANGGKRMGAGPLRIVEAGLIESLTATGHEAQLVPIELESDFPTEIASAFALAHSIKARVAAALERRSLPVILAGNCIAALGAVAALGEPRVTWFDAHADLNTPDSTRSGFLDGMALSILLGRCWSTLAADVGLKPVREDRVYLIGARDLDPAEEEFLRGSSVHRHASDSGASSRDWPTGERIYLHIDLDVLDPTVGTANGYSVPGGLTLENLLTLVGQATQQNSVGAVTLSAYDPTGDSSGTIARAASKIAVAVASDGSAKLEPGRP